MAGLLGTDQKDPAQTTADFLGNESPVAFSSQPALPTGGPGAGGGASTTPPTIGGTGVGAPPAAPEGGGGFADLSGAAMGDNITPGGDPGQASGGLGVGTHGQGLPSANLGTEPVDISLNPFGQLSLNVNTDDPEFNQAVNAAKGIAGTMFGIPTSTNLVSLLGKVLGSPLLGTFGSALGIMGLPLTIPNLLNTLFTMFPQTFSNTMVNQQGRAANMDMMELEQMTPQEIAQMAFATTNPAQMAWTDPSFQIARHQDDSPIGVGAVPGAPGQPGTGAGAGAGTGAGAPGGPGGGTSGEGPGQGP